MKCLTTDARLNRAAVEFRAVLTQVVISERVAPLLPVRATGIESSDLGGTARKRTMERVVERGKLELECPVGL